ncbi:NAD(P)-dependent oxidoreductase [Luteimicrobium xylanilyticum]|uniref:8-hydroxy-5-deazaflavin:NADPH oxidoreductase n=1 Tax=Luteimicrobium xylanilyticum TaxID=1133546 RepID=A0A5P9QBB4_9MICO|nr:NAD(P)-dependent oxidoreductase [Luteimicrobium xylanilyticum]QFU98738.1 8-hydroxy-5-deazaflavin:NADPH oxidoreductase [Luteimicrobium xylanilyticum]
MNVTILGTGIMGSAVAGTLVRAGHQVTAWNRTADKAAPLADQGITVAPSAADAVAGAEVVLSIVFDTDAVLDVLDDAGPAVPDGAVWAQATTIGVDGTKEVAARAAELGVSLVEAQMLGTKGPASRGELAILTAGDPALVERARPVLDAMSSKTLHAGDEVGCASALKIACNAWLATITAGVAQSLALTSAQGLDPQLFLDAITDTATDCRYAHLKADHMLSEDLAPTFTVDALRKDVGLSIQVARSSGTAVTLLDAVSRVLGVASLDGHGKEDVAAVYDAFTTTPLGNGD